VCELRTAGIEWNGQSDGFYHGPTRAGNRDIGLEPAADARQCAGPVPSRGDQSHLPRGRAQLIAAATSQEANQGIEQFGLKTDGTLFAMPSGM